LFYFCDTLYIDKKGGVYAKNNSIHRGRAGESFSYNEAKNRQVQRKASRNRRRDYQESFEKFFAQYYSKIKANGHTR
jgi:hypothetical protein